MNYTAQDWKGARAIERMYKSIGDDLTPFEFVAFLPALPESNSIFLFLLAANTRSSVDWLKRRYATPPYQHMVDS